jgi:hypothetical protein
MTKPFTSCSTLAEWGTDSRENPLSPNYHRRFRTGQLPQSINPYRMRETGEWKRTSKLEVKESLPLTLSMTGHLLFLATIYIHYQRTWPCILRYKSPQ